MNETVAPSIVIEERSGVPLRVYAERAASIAELLARATAAVPTQTALIEHDETGARVESVTYEELADRVATFAGGLMRDHGVTAGARVGLLHGNGIDWAVAFLGVVHLGAIAVPLNTRWTVNELSYVVGDSEPALLICDEAHAQRVRELQAPSVAAGAIAGDAVATQVADEEAPAAIFYTSGTTGRSKGAVMRHRNFVHNAITVRLLHCLPCGVRSLIMVPLYHVTGCNTQLIAGLELRATTSVIPAFKAETSLSVIAQDRIQATIGAPAMYWLWLVNPSRDRYDLSSLTHALYGGAPMPPELLRQLREALPGVALGNGYGLTETSSIATYLPDEETDERPDSVGRPAPVVEIRAVDLDGRDVPTGEAGELVIRGPNVISEYWRKPAESAAALREGWLHTGDIGRIDSDGFVYVLDRIKDMINRGGEKIYSAEVENVLYRHPAVLEAAVFGVPDEVFGESVAARVVPKPGATVEAEEIRTFCATLLASYKVPKTITVTVDPLPRNAAGKILKSAIREDAITEAPHA